MKKSERNSEKGVDNRKREWYYIQAASRSSSEKRIENDQKRKKKFKKLRKKFLTNNPESDKLIKLTDEAERLRAARICTL